MLQCSDICNGPPGYFVLISTSYSPERMPSNSLVVGAFEDAGTLHFLIALQSQMRLLYLCDLACHVEM